MGDDGGKCWLSDGGETFNGGRDDGRDEDGMDDG